MSSTNYNQFNKNMGSFRPHPRSRSHIKYNSNNSYPQIQQDSNSDGFIPLISSSPLSNQKQFKQNLDASSDFSKNSHFNNRYHNSRNVGRFYNSHHHVKKKNYNKTNESNIESYYHPSMIEDPWRDLMELYKSISESKVEAKSEDDNQIESNNKEQ